MPRAGLLRSILLNHWYHHRGQLSVYLRLLAGYSENDAIYDSL